MHRSVRWAAGAVAGGVVLVVAASASGTAAGTPSSEPSCQVVRQHVGAVSARYEAAAQRYTERAEQLTGAHTPLTSAERTELAGLTDVSGQHLLQLHATTLASPQCFDADDVELARQAAQQLAPRLAGV